jgi:hypothetical protein
MAAAVIVVLSGMVHLKEAVEWGGVLTAATFSVAMGILAACALRFANMFKLWKVMSSGHIDPPAAPSSTLSLASSPHPPCVQLPPPLPLCFLKLIAVQSAACSTLGLLMELLGLSLIRRLRGASMSVVVSGTLVRQHWHWATLLPHPCLFPPLA